MSLLKERSARRTSNDLRLIRQLALVAGAYISWRRRLKWQRLWAFQQAVLAELATELGDSLPPRRRAEPAVLLAEHAEPPAPHVGFAMLWAWTATATALSLAGVEADTESLIWDHLH